MKTRFRWLIIGGCPRSGTTLLNLLLNSHPAIKITNEVSLSRLLTKIRGLYYREAKAKSAIVRKKSKKELWETETIVSYIPQFEISGIRVLETMYEEQFSGSGELQYLGDKYPRYYVEDLEAVRETLGDLKVIHISRNPIHVINSMMRRAKNAKKGQDSWSTHESIEEGIHEWVAAWRYAVSRRVDPTFIHLKYEELLFETSKAIEAIGSFLDVDVSGFDRTLIISELDEIDSLTEPDLGKIRAYLGDITDAWDKPLDALEQAHLGYENTWLSTFMAWKTARRQWQRSIVAALRRRYHALFRSQYVDR